MARRSHYINNINNRDIKAFNAFSRCGYVQRENLLTCISKSRIENYQKEGLIEKEVHVSNQNETTTAYKFTDKGLDLSVKHTGIDKPYQSQSIIHDCQIADKYFSLSEQERDTWKTETELREQFYEKLEQLREQDYNRYQELYDQYQNREISMPDCSYITETQIEVFYESVTNNYGQAELEAKERAVEVLKTDTNTSYETSR